VICDPFAGSGSTLITAERTSRIGLAIEISPAYCEVICQGFLDATGQTPTLATGARFEAKASQNHQDRT
jgi:DNA modification methylase